MGFVVFLLWILLAVVCGSLGRERKIGGTGAFIIAILFSPLIGFIVVFASSKKQPAKPKPWVALIEQGKIEVFKGHKTEAIDKFKEALYHLTEAEKVAGGKYLLQTIQTKIEEVNLKIKEAESLA